MAWYEKLSIVVASVLVMERFAWAAHNYVMHGWGWAWHRSHHYATTFAGVVVALFLAGVRWEPLWWIAVGVTLYGAIYALVHDMLVHQRFGMRWVPRRGYLKRLHQAHRLHHAVKGREGGVSFGFLFAPDPARLKRHLSNRADR